MWGSEVQASQPILLSPLGLDTKDLTRVWNDQRQSTDSTGAMGGKMELELLKDNLCAFCQLFWTTRHVTSQYLCLDCVHIAPESPGCSHQHFLAECLSMLLGSQMDMAEGCSLWNWLQSTLEQLSFQGDLDESDHPGKITEWESMTLNSCKSMVPIRQRDDLKWKNVFFSWNRKV